MKNQLFTLAAVLTASAALTGCSSEQMAEVVTAQEQNAGEAKTYQVAITATKPGSSDLTRALYMDGDALKTKWADGEKVYVYKDDNEYVGCLTPATPGSTSTTLTGTISGEFTTSNTLTLYYLKPKAAVAGYEGTSYYGDYSGQKGTRDDIGSNYDFMKAASVAIEQVGPTSMLTGNGGNYSDNILKTGTATFVREQAITKFTVNKKNSSDAFAITSSNPLKIEATAVDLTVTPESSVSEVWVAMPGSASKTYKFESTSDSKAYGVSKSVALTNDKYYTATLTMGRDIEKITVAGIPAAGGSQTFDGSAVNVTGASSNESEGMTATTDYTVTYYKNTGTTESPVWAEKTAGEVKDAGQYKAVITGAGDYEGTIESGFTISKNTTAPTITVNDGVDGIVLAPNGTQPIGATALGSTEGFTYSVSPATGVVSVSADGTITADGAGTATITITLEDNGNHVGNTKDITVYVKQSGIGGTLPEPGTGGTW